MASPLPEYEVTLQKLLRICPACGGPLWKRFDENRTIVFPEFVFRMHIPVCRCQRLECPLFKKSYHAEGASRWAQHYNNIRFMSSPQRAT